MKIIEMISCLGKLIQIPTNKLLHLLRAYRSNIKNGPIAWQALYVVFDLVVSTYVVQPILNKKKINVLKETFQKKRFFIAIRTCRS